MSENLPLPGVDQAIARVRAYAREKGWRKTRLAREAGLHPNTLRHFDNDNWNPLSDTLRQLEALVPAEFEAPGERAP